MQNIVLMHSTGQLLLTVKGELRRNKFPVIYPDRYKPIEARWAQLGASNKDEDIRPNINSEIKGILH